MKRLPSFQRGFAAMAAVFIVVVLAALGAFMLTLSNTQHLTAAQDVQGSRAYWAARAGLEWGITQVIATSACPAASATFVVDTFNLEVSCDATNYDDEGRTVTMVKMTSVACTDSPCDGTNAGTVSYVERSVSTSIER